METRTPPRRICAVLLTLALLGLARPAHAGLMHHFSATVDISSPTIQPQGADQFDLYSFTGVQPTFTLNAGDTISGTITFANGLSLQVVDPDGSHFDYFGLAMYAQAYSSSDFSYTTHLLGGTGQLNGSTTKSNIGLGNSVIGAYFFDLTASSVAFTGFDYAITVNANSGNNVYQPANVQVFHAATPVPEPDTALFGIATAAAAILSRRRGAARRASHLHAV